MGVVDLWEVVEAAVGERVPLSVFSVAFARQHGRPVRLAIDAYIWLFETGHYPGFTPGDADGSVFGSPYKMVQGFISRLVALVGLDVAFVVVFDGDMKPAFKRAESSFEMARWTSEDAAARVAANFESFKDLYYHSAGDGLRCGAADPEEVTLLKRVLAMLGIEYLDAAGEAESECARLQSMGVVDYVVSRDSDAMLFGATCVLRNFSKNYQFSEQDEYYVDPVHLAHFYATHGVSRSRLILFAVLRGADYNSGFQRIGTTRAKRIAFCGTDLSEADPTCHDFHPEFQKLFVDPTDESSKLSLPDLVELESQYTAFLHRLESEVSGNAIAYFGRNDVLQFNHFSPFYIPLLYYYPILRKEIFRFTRGTLNAQFDSQVPDTFPQDMVPQLKSFERLKNGGLRFKCSTSGEAQLDATCTIQLQDLIAMLDGKLPNVANCERYLHSTLATSLLLRFLSSADRDSTSAVIKVRKVKILPSRNEAGRLARADHESGTNLVRKWIVDMYQFKFDTAEVLDAFTSGRTVRPNQDDAQSKTHWISKELLLANGLNGYIVDFENRQQAKIRSPKRRLQRQSSTLESLGMSISPSKVHAHGAGPLLPMQPASPSKSRVVKPVSPKKSTSRTPKPQAGQAMITKFFQPAEKESASEFLTANGENSGSDEEWPSLVLINDLLQSSPSKHSGDRETSPLKSPVRSHAREDKVIVIDSDNESETEEQIELLNTSPKTVRRLFVDVERDGEQP